MKKIAILANLLAFALSVSAQEKAVHYKELQKILPSEINGFSSTSDPEGNSFEMNGMSYSTASKQYTKGDSELTIVLIDYKGATSIYQASTMAWAGGMSYEDDHQKAHGISVNGMNGWYSLDKDNGRAQVIVGHKERYLITVEVTNSTDQSMAENILKKLNVNALP